MFKDQQPQSENRQGKTDQPYVTSQHYGHLKDGRAIEQICLISKQLEVRLLTYGGIITEILVPDRQGNIGNVVLNYDNLEAYESNDKFFGCLVGRYANRIAGGQFLLGEALHQLSRNHGEHHLHGGKLGFDKQVWHAKPFTTEESAGVDLTYVSDDGEQGYPGQLAVKVRYQIHHGALAIEYSATTDQPTLFNPTQHSYFNLSADPQQTVLAHQLQLHSNHFLELDEQSIPTGKYLSSKGTAFDFSAPKTIGQEIDAKEQQLQQARGYDHYFVQDKPRGELTLFAELTEPSSQRSMSVWTTEVGAQVYTANYLLPKHQGICLETGLYPDAPNHPLFPLVLVTPEAPFYSRTEFHFGVC